MRFLRNKYNKAGNRRLLRFKLLYIGVLGCYMLCNVLHTANLQALIPFNAAECEFMWVGLETLHQSWSVKFKGQLWCKVSNVKFIGQLGCLVFSEKFRGQLGCNSFKCKRPTRIPHLNINLSKMSISWYLPEEDLKVNLPASAESLRVRDQPWFLLKFLFVRFLHFWFLRLSYSCH